MIPCSEKHTYDINGLFQIDNTDKFPFIMCIGGGFNSPLILL